MSLLVSVCAEEEQATGRHGLKHCGCLRNLGAAQVLRLVAAAIPGADSIEGDPRPLTGRRRDGSASPNGTCSSSSSTPSVETS